MRENKDQTNSEYGHFFTQWQKFIGWQIEKNSEKEKLIHSNQVKIFLVYKSFVKWFFKYR